ncbi:MAG: hypothetical protein GY859_43925, partial [Desulfobacterales bacterium]|nr:hypothetical protein [Desulfobacterales bacterium]
IFQILELGKYNGDLEAGSPNLPTLRKHIYIPMGKMARVEVTPGAPAVFEDFLVFPMQQPQQDSPDAVEPPFAMNEAVYAADSYFPAESAFIGESQSIRGHEIALLHICPFRYNPARGVLEVYNRMRVTIHFEGMAMAADARYASSAFDGFIHGIVANPGSFVGYAPAEEQGDAEGAEFLIITGPDFASAAEDLRDHKETLGISTVVKTTDETGTTTGDIKSYIQDAYDAWSPAPAYVLLLGDVETIPTTYETTSARGTDLYYSTVAGADYTPDIFLGRISVDTLAEARVVVQKIINYESNPPAQPSFYTNAMVAAYFQDGPPYSGVLDGYEDRRFLRTAEEVRDLLLSRGKSVERAYCRKDNGVAPTNYNYGYYGSGEPLPDELLVSNGFAWDGAAADISAAVNSGVFLLMHRDHGMDRNGGYFRTGWGDPYFVETHVEALSNGDLLPVVFSVNCQTGWFDGETDDNDGRSYESFSELFLRKEGGGAVGVFGAVRNSYSGYNDALAKGFLDCVWPDFLPSVPNNSGASSRLGHMLNHGKLAMDVVWGNPWGIRQTQYELFHLFGDPTLEMWTSQPGGPETHTIRAASSPAIGAPVSVSPADVNGAGDGNANFTRTYAHGANVTLTAAATFNNATFIKWVVDGVDYANRSILVAMDAYYEATAVYSTVYTLTVDSSPVSGVAVTAAPDDIYGAGNGSAGFTRVFGVDESVTLVAPATHGGREFVRWVVDGGTVYTRTLRTTMNQDHAARAEYTILPEDRRALIIDLDGNNNSAPEIAIAAEANGVETDLVTAMPESIDHELHPMTFVSLGVCWDNHILTSAEGDVLKAYLDNGGALYMEGGDTWEWDSPTSVHPYFGIDGLLDGGSDTVTVSGVSGAFTDGIVFTYQGDNLVMDHIDATDGAAGAFLIWDNASEFSSYHNGVARDAGSFKTIGVSFEFGGIPSARRNEIMESYLDFGLRYTLTAQSTPAEGVPIALSPDDVKNAGDGATGFTRNFNEGTEVSLTAPATHEGRHFIQWLVDGEANGSQVIQVVMNENHEVEAVYSNLYTLTAASAPVAGVEIALSPDDVKNEGNGAADFTRTYDEETEVTLIAPASHEGRHFIQWLVDGEANGNRTIQVVMNDNHEVEAVYSNLYTLTAGSTPVAGVEIALSPDDVKNEGGGATGFTRSYEEGTEVSLTAPASHEDRQFVQWLVDGEANGNQVIQVVMNDHHEVEAVYSDAASSSSSSSGAQSVEMDGGEYDSIQEAYGTANNGIEIKCASGNYAEHLVFDRDVSVVFSGGYDDQFIANSGSTTIQGSVTLRDGLTVVENIVIGGP